MSHKYGFHVNRSGDDVFEAIQRIKPSVIKTLELDVGFWKRVREAHPDLFLIGRQYVPNQQQEQFVHDPVGIGRAFAQRILNLEVNDVDFHGRPLFDAWESYNEVMPGQADAILKRQYDEFQVAFAEPFLNDGRFEPIAMNFATGNMLGKDFLDYFAGTLETYRYLGFHEYDWPDMWRLHEENIVEKGEDGMWLALRYRRIMQEVRTVYGEKHTVLVTECGMTQGVQRKNDVGPWHESYPISEQRYWDSLMWYNDEMEQDDYVMAACLFVVGAVHPWESFEHLGGITNRLAQLQAGTSPVVVTKPSLPELIRPEIPVPSQPISPPPIPARPDVVEPIDNLPLPQKLLEEAERHQLIRFNPSAALQKRIFANGFVPNSNEFRVESGGVDYIAQRAERMGSGEVRVYYVRIGDWGNVKFVRHEVVARSVSPHSVSPQALPYPGEFGGDEAEAAEFEIDPIVREAWQNHMAQGFENNQKMFQEVLNAFMKPYYTTIWMYRILFGVGIGLLLAAIILSVIRENPLFSLFFGGLGTVSFLAYFVSKPLRSLEDNLYCITRLGVVYNSYWTRLLYMNNKANIQDEIDDAMRDAVQEIDNTINKSIELSNTRPGVR